MHMKYWLRFATTLSSQQYIELDAVQLIACERAVLPTVVLEAILACYGKFGHT